MKKIYCIKCNKYRKIKDPKISCTLVLSIIYHMCGSIDKKIFKEIKTIEVLKILCSI